jgi:hypothetical protein
MNFSDKLLKDYLETTKNITVKSVLSYCINGNEIEVKVDFLDGSGFSDREFFKIDLMEVLGFIYSYNKDTGS